MSWTPGPWELRGDYVCLPSAPGVDPEHDDTPPLVDIETWGATTADGKLIALAPEMAAAILDQIEGWQGCDACEEERFCRACVKRQDRARDALPELAEDLRAIRGEA